MKTNNRGLLFVDNKSENGLFALGYLFLVDIYMILLQAQITGIPGDFISARLNLLYVITGISVFYNFRNIFRLSPKKLFLSVQLFSAYILASAFFIAERAVDLRSLFDVIFGVMIFLTSLSLLNDLNAKTFRIIISYKLFYFVFTIVIFIWGYFVFETTQGAFINSIFYLVALAPFLLLLKNKKTSLILILLIALLALLVGKRTAFLLTLLIIGFQVSLQVGGLSRISIGVRMLLMALVFMIICIAIWQWGSQYNLVGIDRLALLVSDGGSGRVELANLFLSQITSSSLWSYVFGHGSISVLILGFGNLSVHNDFLEVFYRLGAVGLFLFCVCGRRLIKEASRIKLISSQDGGALLMALILYVALSSVSMLIFVPSYVVQFYIFFALVCGRYSKSLSSTLKSEKP